MNETMNIAPVQPMTLGRFVRVTLQNFRLLLSTISGNDPSIAMSTATNAGQEAQPSSAEKAQPMTVPTIEFAETETTDRELVDSQAFARQAATVTASAPMLSDPPDVSDVAPAAVDAPAVQAAMQPALDLSASDEEAIVTAQTESGELLVRVGEAALPMQSALESLLFVADAPVEAAQLARAVNAPVEVVETHLRALDDLLRAQARGLRVAERNGRFQMVTAPAAAALIEAFLNLDMTTRLSAPALETLAIVAYRQPVTRAQIEAVRGVDCSGVLRSLVQRGLIEEVDRLDAPGRPVRYGVTDLFMHHFGLTTMQELPPLPAVESEQIDNALAREE